MSVFRRFSNIFQQKSNAALDRLEDPSQAIDLSYQQLLEQQQKLRTALVEATAGQKRLENQAGEMDKRIVQLNASAQQAMQSGKEDLATQALTQAEVLGQQRHALDPQIQTISAQVTKLQQAIQRYQARGSCRSTSSANGSHIRSSSRSRPRGCRSRKSMPSLALPNTAMAVFSLIAASSSRVTPPSCGAPSTRSVSPSSNGGR